MSPSEHDERPVADLARLLATLTVSRRPGTFCVASADPGAALGNGVDALIVEGEGMTAICTVARAQREGWDYEFPCAWLTLDVFSALEAVGLTAAVAKALSEADIPCNVIAARHHDHILVPTDQIDEAVEAIESLRSESTR